jgi:EmrB/QacA subfamily drug resistance transporter
MQSRTFGVPTTTYAVAVMLMLYALDITIIATALPTITAELHGAALYGWAFAAYTIPATTTTLLYGRIADIVGRRRLFPIIAIGFLVGSLLCAGALSMLQLVLARVVQGMFAGAIFPLAVGIIADTYPMERRAAGFAIVPTVFAFASVLGPVLGGLITDSVGWRWLFLLNVPLIALALVVFLRTYPSGLQQPSALRLSQLDYPGFVLFAAGVTSILVGLSAGGGASWTGATVLGPIALGIALIGAFVIVEQRARVPLLPLRILRHRGLGGAVFSIFLMALITNTALVMTPIFDNAVLGGSARSAGLVLIPLMLTWSITANIAVRLGQRHGFRTLARYGLLAMGLGLGTFVAIARMGNEVSLILPMVLIGAGAGLINPNMLVLAQASVSDRDQSLAGGLGNFSLSLGAAVAAPLLISLELQRLAAHIGPELGVLDPARLLSAEARAALASQLGPAGVAQLQTALGAAVADIFAIAFVPLAVLSVWLFTVVPSNEEARRIRLAPLNAAAPASAAGMAQRAPVAAPD